MSGTCRTCGKQIDARTLQAGGEVCFECSTVPEDRWKDHSPAFQAEHPWCGWTVAFAHGSDWDTTVFGLERLVGINILLTTADGKSRPVNIIDWQRIDAEYEASTDPHRDCDRKAGIFVRELDTEHYEPLDPTGGELVPYEDIREIVVF